MVRILTSKHSNLNIYQTSHLPFSHTKYQVSFSTRVKMWNRWTVSQISQSQSKPPNFRQYIQMSSTYIVKLTLLHNTGRALAHPSFFSSFSISNPKYGHWCHSTSISEAWFLLYSSTLQHTIKIILLYFFNTGLLLVIFSKPEDYDTPTSSVLGSMLISLSHLP